MFKAVANSTAALKSMRGSFGALGGGVIDAKLGEQIAVAIADAPEPQAVQCDDTVCSIR